MPGLNILSQTHPIELSILSTSLEPVSTAGNLGQTSQKIVPTHTFAAPPASPIDILFLPGGAGARVPNGNPELKAFLVEHAPAASAILTVCTGSGLLATTGLLDSVRATGNKSLWSWTVQQSDKVRWVHRARWVEDGKFWTSSGISAGIDMMLAWVAATFGEEQGQIIADKLEIVWQRDSTRDPFADRYPYGDGVAS